jgi:hypothetical protein
MQILEGPSKTVLNSSLPNETLLIHMHQLGNDPLHSVCQQFSYQFDWFPKQRNGSIIISR